MVIVWFKNLSLTPLDIGMDRLHQHRNFHFTPQTVKQYYCGTSKQDTSSLRHLVMCLAITMPTSLVDVNLEPNKTRVLLQNSVSRIGAVTTRLFGG